MVSCYVIYLRDELLTALRHSLKYFQNFNEPEQMFHKIKLFIIH